MGGRKNWRDTILLGQPLGLEWGKVFENKELVLSSFGVCVWYMQVFMYV